MTSKISTRLLQWVFNGDTGLSSKAMAAHLYCIRIENEFNRVFHPSDASDFGRCVELLAAVPEMRVHVFRMAELSPTWAAIVASWDELECLYLICAGAFLTRRIHQIETEVSRPCHPSTN